MKKTLIILFSILILFSCKTQKQAVIEVPVQYKERVVERLVPYAVAGDSATLKAWFECDSLNQVILKQLDEEKGRAQSNVNFQSGKLTYQLIRKVDTVYVQAKDSIIYKEIPVRVSIETEVNRLTKWQAFQIMAFRIILIALGVFVAWRYFNPISTAFHKLLKR